MHVWNVLHVASWKCRMQKWRKKLLCMHRRTTLSGCIFATKVRIDNPEKNLLNSNIFSTCAHNMANFGPNGWDRLASLGHPSKFQRVSRLAFVTAATSLTGGQPIFVWCLAVCWAGTLYMHFRELLPPDRIFPGAKFTLRPSLVFAYIGSVTAWHSSSRHQPNFAASYKEWNYGTFAEGATYIRQGGHHVGHRPTF